jgi:hypothetical protein
VAAVAVPDAALALLQAVAALCARVAPVVALRARVAPVVALRARVAPVVALRAAAQLLEVPDAVARPEVGQRVAVGPLGSLLEALVSLPAAPASLFAALVLPVPSLFVAPAPSVLATAASVARLAAPVLLPVPVAFLLAASARRGVSLLARAALPLQAREDSLEVSVERRRHCDRCAYVHLRYCD